MTTPDNVTQNTNSPYLNLPKRSEAELRDAKREEALRNGAREAVAWAERVGSGIK